MGVLRTRACFFNPSPEIKMNTRQLPLFLSSLSAVLSFALFTLPVHAQESAKESPKDSALVEPAPNARMAEFAPERVEKGRVMYKQLCLRCHGPEMVGGNNAYDLRQFPIHDRDRFFNSVTNGKRAMPPWKGMLNDEEIGMLWAYVGTRGGKL